MTSRTVLITGAARGIGLGIAETFARDDWNVVIADLGARGADARDTNYAMSGSAELDAAVAHCDALGAGSVVGTPVDVTDRDACAAAVAAAIGAFGRLDLLINNAGVATSGAIGEVTEAAWDLTLDVNAKGTFLMCQAAVAAMEDGAAIINIASIAGREGYADMAPYCASKFAVIGLTQALATELAPRRIRVNAICPGVLGTAMWLEHLLPRIVEPGGDNRAREAQFEEAMADSIPLGRPQTPADIAGAARYLADATNVTGVELTVAGGLVMG